jgi:hypothetical protein
LLGIAAAIALVLGLVGVYGVISYQPRQSRWPSGATLRGKAGNAFFRAPGPGHATALARRPRDRAGTPQAAAAPRTSATACEPALAPPVARGVRCRGYPGAPP